MGLVSAFLTTLESEIDSSLACENAKGSGTGCLSQLRRKRQEDPGANWAEFSYRPRRGPG